MVRQAHHKMKTEILQKDAPVLRKTAKSVPVKEIGSKKIQNILSRMKEALYTEEDGVAIAAPQIGESLRIFVVKGDVLTFIRNKNGKLETQELSEKKVPEDMIFINPEITKTSKKKKDMEEGCLSVRWLYGYVKRSEKVTIRSYDENGKLKERGASGLLAQIFQHETDHLNGILFIDTATNVRDMPPEHPQTKVKPATSKLKFVFFGASTFSRYVLEELESAGFSPALKITSAREPLPVEKLRELKADVFIVASFGKILPKEIIDLPKYKTLNVHPSLLPKLRGATPIQNTILGLGEPGVTIMKLDEKIDHGPILAQIPIPISPWPDHYRTVEEKLGRAGGQLLGPILSKWVTGKIEKKIQNDLEASYTKEVKKEDGLLELDGPAEVNWRKVLAYSNWPGAYIIFKNKFGKEVRVVIKDAEIRDGKFRPTRIVPAGKKEMSWEDFLRGN
ncbi:MAG: peptide deformylase [Candidatus Zambryskibacteria bacterium CG_4_9_14_3_um_filter_42_15]|uniref:Peptide deformylase n=1 Tax=Candidatus Zambryskibacteria bacterium CG_4_9_14_3_um_filter_42_15 TaxID=1975112 RepID=A0A2M7WSE8_9BACT|nr:MAG: peptide deformylase [Candidatus Zambryskibacteria bacterium CG_4_9_14_3_um_filter_42_15]